MDKLNRMKELVEILNKASKAYYSEDAEQMSNFEYDTLYEELEQLEKETGTILSASPTVNVGYESVDFLEKERHDSPMLSLDKTKDPAALAAFLGDQKGLLSWKLDGLTVVLTYENGTLLKAVTRGNGEVGEVITANARTFENLPLTIPAKGRCVLRGESVIRYSDFETINAEIPDLDAKYKNPRNLCSGSVRQLDAKITAERHVRFYAFALVSAEGVEFDNSNETKYRWMKEQGFEVVPYKPVTKDTVEETVAWYAEAIRTFDIPSDGLVLLMDDIAYGESLGRTAKFPRNAIAFKWKDETAETQLLEIEWSPSRTGLINPVAVFAPVELEGTTVSRASVHNVSIIESLALGIGDTIVVYKANMIIPQIAENKTRSGNLTLPAQCPACGGETFVREENGVKTLLCRNPECPAKKIKSFVDFVGRSAMNIDGISEETLEKFIAHGFLSDFSDLFHLAQHKEEIVSMPGFGEKSFENIISAVEAARNVTADRVLNGLGILGVGAANAKAICRFFQDDLQAIRTASPDVLMEIEGIGDVLAENIASFFQDPKKSRMVDALLAELSIAKQEASEAEQVLKGLTFVITGSLNSYPNRDALKAEIESKGGKVSGSVSSKTSFLINNDAASASSKNKTAKKLGIPIITEKEYIEKFRSF